MMEILSFGNQLHTGEFTIHSRFSSALNFMSGDTFAFVVNESVGSGPLNIVINGFVPDSVNSLKIEDSCIKLDGKEFRFESNKRYDSTVDFSKYGHDLFVKNLGIVEKVVVEKATPQSLSFLLSDENVSMGGFHGEVRRIIKSGVEQILYGNLISGVKMIKGLGPGLTPSGDDFNSGLLIAMNVVKKIGELKQTEEWIPAPTGRSRLFAGMTIMQVYEAARGKNLFTNSFLLCAAKGHLFFKFRKLMSALVHSNVGEIINNTELVLTMGETSGADQLTGFLIGMKRFLI
jgi:hypothetical protein